MAIVRIAFGLVIAIDAWFKWQPSFVHGFTNYLSSATAGQPQVVKDWINLVLDVVKVNPHVFARLIALGETAVAIGLILGVFSNTTFVVGALLTATIWSTAEGFGGPYKAGSTDIGAAIIYVFVFAALWISHGGRTWGLDRRLDNRLGRWSVLCSGKW
jgi:nitrite reductase (NO-forming)